MSGGGRRWPLPLLAVTGTAVGLGLIALVLDLRVVVAYQGFSDFDAYRAAIGRLLAGDSLYAQTDPATAPFIYPPFAALLMIPMTWLSPVAGKLVWALVQVGCCAALVVLVGRRTPLLAGRSRAETGILALAGLLLLCFSVPVNQGIWLGQISLVVATAALVDLWLVPPRWRGLLTGVAAAAKITPAAFVLYLLFTRQWRAAARLAVGFLAATTIGFLVLPGQSWEYWTRVFSFSGMPADLDYPANHSLLGLIARAGVEPPGQRWLWIALALPVAALGTWQAWRRHRSGAELAAILTMGFTIVAVAPLSWAHYLLWLPLTGLYLVTSARGWPRWLGAAILVGGLIGSPLINSTAWPPVSENLTAVVLLSFACLGVPSAERDLAAGSAVRGRETAVHA